MSQPSTSDYSAAFRARLAGMVERYPHEQTEPEPAYLAESRDMRVYHMLGYLESTVVAIAEDHAGCRVQLCPVCRHLAIGLAGIGRFYKAVDAESATAAGEPS